MSEKLKLLVVDDNEQFCQNVSDIMELKGYEVVAAYDGFKALELVERNDFDLMLMDIIMPVMDGTQTLKKVKEIAPNIPVIMITAYAGEDIIREALREGAFGVLKKPLDFNKLSRLIRNAIPNGTLVMVVDDDENLCANMKDVLNDKGYRVSVAYNGNTAIEKAGENNFDIILVDLKMPALNGLETYLAIRDFRPNVVAIVITGYRQEMAHLVQQARRETVYACLEKPIAMDELVSLLAQIREQQNKGILKKPE